MMQTHGKRSRARRPPATTDEPSFPRQFGEYVLVAQLGDDGLGTVYRAIHATEERRFVRLRILQSPELSPEKVCEAIRKNAERAMALSHKAIVPRLDMRILGDVPYMAWYEGAGWTLDLVLARLRAAGRQIPVEYALLIAERAAAAACQGWFSVVDGEPFHHGLIWPGFISLSNDAEVRMGGFGLAEAVLPALSKPRLLRDIAPYVAPEVREGGKIGANSDVYSLGVLLVELLTCRHATVDRRMGGLRAGDPFAAEVSACLRLAFAEPDARFSSVVQIHRALQELLAESPYAISTASFGVFLYDLLNTETQLLAITDGESTNPIEVEAPREVAESPAKEPRDAAASSQGDRRKRTLIPLLPSATHDQGSFPKALQEPARDTPVPQTPLDEPGQPEEKAEMVAKALDSGASAGTEPYAPATDSTSVSRGPKPPAPEDAPALSPTFSPLRAHPESKFSPWRWVGSAAAAVALGLIAMGILHSRPKASSAPAPGLAARTSLLITPAPAPVPTPESAVATAPKIKKTSSNAVARVSARKPKKLAVGSRSAPALKPSDDPERKSADASRLAAALARIDAEKLDASKLAAEPFATGRSSEKEGERLFGEQDWSEARASFERAANFFREAQGAAREERVRRLKPSSDHSP